MLARERLSGFSPQDWLLQGTLPTLQLLSSPTTFETSVNRHRRFCRCFALVPGTALTPPLPHRRPSQRRLAARLANSLDPRLQFPHDPLCRSSKLDVLRCCHPTPIQTARARCECPVADTANLESYHRGHLHRSDRAGTDRGNLPHRSTRRLHQHNCSGSSRLLWLSLQPD